VEVADQIGVEHDPVEVVELVGPQPHLDDERQVLHVPEHGVRQVRVVQRGRIVEVPAVAAVDRVRLPERHDGVVPLAAEHQRVRAAGEQFVLPRAAVERVPAALAVERVLPRPAIERVGARLAEQQVAVAPGG